jgi:hypothetical protein
MHEKALRQFKFTLKGNHEFNYLVYIDIMYLNSKPTLYVINLVTAFRAVRFIKDMSTYKV